MTAEKALLRQHLVGIAELQQQPELVAEIPGVLPFAVDDLRDADLGRFDPPSGRRQAVERLCWTGIP